MSISRATLVVVIGIFLGGCFAFKGGVQSDQDIYESFVGSLEFGDSKQSDLKLLELLSQYPNSPLIVPALELSIDNSIKKSQYEVADLYLKQLTQRVYSASSKAYLEYLDLRLKYKKLKGTYRQQANLQKTKTQLEDYLDLNPNSPYFYHIQTMLSHINVAIWLGNTSSAQLYEKLKKPKAQAFYKAKNQSLDRGHIIVPDQNFLEYLFN